MIASATNSELYPEWIAHIDSEEAKDAFRYLVGIAAGLTTLTCHPQYKGEVRDFRFIDVRNEQPFSFIPNKAWLLFYFRAPAIRTGRYAFVDLKHHFNSAIENNKGEWTVKLKDIADVQRLWTLIGVE